ncbi:MULTISPECIES: peptidoglycan-binding domain-containing protein [unclassified Kitasatospora]|uniref:peptidoglycan-binding domain-containing protein n=1 Tax=unclassified Kitasatospora TaxID=2633591 RepID=UPI0033C9BD66
MSMVARIGKGAVALAMAGASVLGVTGSASAAPGASYIGPGYATSGAGVWCVQHSINYFLANNGSAYRASAPYWSLDEDSQWGPKTEAEVRWFQAHWGYDQDGIVGPTTGFQILVYGEPKFSGTPWNGPGYCYWQVPSDHMYGA